IKLQDSLRIPQLFLWPSLYERRHSEAATVFAFPTRIAEVLLLMVFDLKEIVASRLGENYELHERHINRTLVAAQRVIGFDKVYARAEGAYLYDMDNQ